MPDAVGRAVAAVLLSLSLVTATAVPVAAASGGDSRTCFPPGGHDLAIGSEGIQILATVHTSLFTNVTTPGALGLTAVGTAGTFDIVSLRAGVLFDGVSDPDIFRSNPFDRFRIVSEYELRLPMIGVGYRMDESPVEGVERADCSVPSRNATADG